MSQRSVLVLAVLLLSLLGSFGCYSVQEEAPKYDLGVSVEPSDADEGVVCRFQLTHAATGEVISSPTVVVQWNEPAEITQSSESDLLTISVLANRADQTVAYAAMLTAGEETQFEKKGEILLAASSS